MSPCTLRDLHLVLAIQDSFQIAGLDQIHVEARMGYAGVGLHVPKVRDGVGPFERSPLKRSGTIGYDDDVATELESLV